MLVDSSIFSCQSVSSLIAVEMVTPGHTARSTIPITSSLEEGYPLDNLGINKDLISTGIRLFQEAQYSSGYQLKS